MRTLKQGSRGRELTGVRLATVRLVSRWRRTKLGEIGNSCVLVGDRGWERVLQLHDDMAQLRARSIYSASGRWPRILSRRTAVGKEEEHWRSGLVSTAVAVTPVSHGGRG
jgi:hypothetical protein